MTVSIIPYPLYLKPSEDEPEIILDRGSNVFLFKGKSMPEDPGKVFHPVLEWISEYTKNPNPVTILEFRMDYYNSSTARFFVEMLEHFEEIHENGSDVKISWFYHEDDIVMHERGEDIDAVCSLPFEFKTYQD